MFKGEASKAGHLTHESKTISLPEEIAKAKLVTLLSLKRAGENMVTVFIFVFYSVFFFPDKVSQNPIWPPAI